jgi:hypothetical protein
MKLNTKVVETRWDDNKGAWNMYEPASSYESPLTGFRTLEDQKTKQLTYDWAHVFINGTGILNSWKWPDIEGLHSFQGPLMHSAKWDHGVDFEGKTVGVIGTGSTSVQIGPQLQKIAKNVEVYMRSPTWISPPFGASKSYSSCEQKQHGLIVQGALEGLRKGKPVDPGQRQYQFTEEDKKRFREDPDFYLRFRREIEAEINVLFGMYIQGSDLSKKFREIIIKEMHQRMGPGQEELKRFIVPKWSPGCWRISPADGYLEALVKENV